MEDVKLILQYGGAFALIGFIVWRITETLVKAMVGNLAAIKDTLIAHCAASEARGAALLDGLKGVADKLNGRKKED